MGIRGKVVQDLPSRPSMQAGVLAPPPPTPLVCPVMDICFPCVRYRTRHLFQLANSAVVTGLGCRVNDISFHPQRDWRHENRQAPGRSAQAASWYSGRAGLVSMKKISTCIGVNMLRARDNVKKRSQCHRQSRSTNRMSSCTWPCPTSEMSWRPHFCHPSNQ